MAKDFKSLLSEICKIILNFRRVNDIEINSGVYTIGWDTRPGVDAEPRDVYFLLDGKNNEYALSLKQLAGLRIADSADSVTAKWFDEFKNDAGITTFQEKAKELVEKNVTMESIKFKVIAQLKIRNTFVSERDVPVYQDYCYSGRNEYRKKVRELVTRVKTETKGNYYESYDYRTGMQALREQLQATPLLDGKAVEAHIVKLPIFQIV